MTHFRNKIFGIGERIMLEWLYFLLPLVIEYSFYSGWKQPLSAYYYQGWSYPKLVGFIGDRDLDTLVLFRWISNSISLTVNLIKKKKKTRDIGLVYSECGPFPNPHARYSHKKGGSLISFGQSSFPLARLCFLSRSTHFFYCVSLSTNLIC